jgi:hypothetical protein
MTTKLTLTIEQEVIKTAKVYAQQKGRSLSVLVENYLKTLTENDNNVQDLSPRVKRLIGAVKLPDDFDYKESLQGSIEQKHSR